MWKFFKVETHAIFLNHFPRTGLQLATSQVVANNVLSPRKPFAIIVFLTLRIRQNEIEST